MDLERDWRSYRPLACCQPKPCRRDARSYIDQGLKHSHSVMVFG